MSKRILITGSRDWADRGVILKAMRDAISNDSPGEITIVHGACPTGADNIADEIAHQMGTIVEAHPADWNKLGRAAGPMRNNEMVKRGANVVLAFIGPCSSPRCTIEKSHYSHGATHCANKAKEWGISVRSYYSDLPK